MTARHAVRRFWRWCEPIAIGAAYGAALGMLFGMTYVYRTGGF